MASDLTPEELAELREVCNLSAARVEPKHWSPGWFAGFAPCCAEMLAIAASCLPKLLDMAERCADYDRRLGAVMPADFSDWHKNGPKEWPEVAAGVVTNLREREASAIDECEALKIQLQVADRDAAAARHMLGQEIEIRRENERASDEEYGKMLEKLAKEKAAGELLRAAKHAVACGDFEAQPILDLSQAVAKFEAAERAGGR